MTDCHFDSDAMRSRLRAGQLVTGSFVYIPSPKLAELISLCGFDFVVTDQEHGPILAETAQEMIRATRNAQCSAIVRVPYLESHAILSVLRGGADGVHVPGIETPAQASRAVELCRRGAHARGPSSAEPLLVVHIESLEAVRSLPELLKLDGVDVYFIGPTDLSHSMGQPGIFDARLQQEVDGAIARIVDSGRVAGIITTSPQAARDYLEKGVRYLATHALSFMTQGSIQFLGSMRG